ncbi:hypothetical protein HMPREF9554_01216 [Treponema phagedenis F0421]|nr:hypothetical protein HMPREF9554_01216 [Treponema phagedenis F0421]
MIKSSLQYRRLFLSMSFVFCKCVCQNSLIIVLFYGYALLTQG